MSKPTSNISAVPIERLEKKESLFLIMIKVLEASRNYPVRLRGTTAIVLFSRQPPLLRPYHRAQQKALTGTDTS